MWNLNKMKLSLGKYKYFFRKHLYHNICRSTVALKMFYDVKSTDTYSHKIFSLYYSFYFVGLFNQQGTLVKRIQTCVWEATFRFDIRFFQILLEERLILNANKIVHMICFSSLLISWINVKSISHLESSNHMLLL